MPRQHTSNWDPRRHTAHRGAHRWPDNTKTRTRNKSKTYCNAHWLPRQHNPKLAARRRTESVKRPRWRATCSMLRRWISSSPCFEIYLSLTRRQQVTLSSPHEKCATVLRSCKRPEKRSFHFWRAGFGVRSKYVASSLPKWSVFKSHLDYVVSATLRLKKGQANCTARVGPKI